MKKEVYYPEYLKLNQILGAQELESEKNNHPAHDEMLFIITHQTLELWMKQIHFELDSILVEFQKTSLSTTGLSKVHHRLRRIIKIQKLMVGHFDVLETMAPLDFLDFRDDLIPASGFQSLQFKLLEKKFGVYPRHSKEMRAYSKQALQDKEKIHLDEKTFSLFEGVQSWLERNPFLQSQDYDFEKTYKSTVNTMFQSELDLIQNHPHLNDDQKEKEILNAQKLKSSFESIFSDSSDVSEALSKKAVISALFIHLYRDHPMLHVPYQVVRYLIEVDANHATWKHRHLSMVQKMIGLKMGTGGSSGQQYLSDSIQASRIFPDLVSIPSYLISRKNIPQLPENIADQLDFRWV